MHSQANVIQGLGRLRVSTGCFRTANATESRVERAAIGRAFHPGSDPVAAAIVVAAHERAAPLDALDVVRLVRIEAVGRAGRIAQRTIAVIVGSIKVAAPFPDVARHVEQAVAVGRERGDRGRRAEAVLHVVAYRETRPARC